MSVRDTTNDAANNQEAASVTDEEARKRFRQLAWGQPDFNFSILEALMDHLELTKEQQREIIAEGARKWQQT